MTSEKEVIMNIVHNYATVLNNTEAGSISSFYSEEGIFMPDGLGEISKKSLQKTNGAGFHQKNKFNIKYSLLDIVVDDKFAFVTTLAESSIQSKTSGVQENRTTRDFFVFRKEKDDWMILRYLFNNVSLKQN